MSLIEIKQILPVFLILSQQEKYQMKKFLGISLGALPFICPELIKAKLEWQQLVENVKTVTTQGGQLWLKPTLKELGWAKDSPVMGTYVEPLDTYADMTHLISRENWPANNCPQQRQWLELEFSCRLRKSGRRTTVLFSILAC